MILPNFKAGYVKHSKIEATSIVSTGNQTYTVPAGVTHLAIEMWGAGGGGGPGRGPLSPKRSGGGGGSGAYTYIVLTEDFKKGDTVNFTVGSGGAGGAAATTAGEQGGPTSLNTYVRSGSTLATYTNKNANGGVGGGYPRSNANAPGGSGGTTNGGISPSSNGSSGIDGVSNTGCASGGSGGDPPMTLISFSGNGGVCNIITDIASDGFSGSTAGQGGGGGGASGSNVFLGGSGANGKVVVTAYARYPSVPVGPNIFLGF